MNLFPLEINEVLPHKLFYSLSQTVEEDLSYGNTSTHNPYDSALFGTRDVHKLIFYEAAVRLKLKIQKFLKRDLDISRIRVNATVDGQEADWHVDSTVEGTWAAVIYTYLSWDPVFFGIDGYT